MSLDSLDTDLTLLRRYTLASGYQYQCAIEMIVDDLEKMSRRPNDVVCSRDHRDRRRDIACEEVFLQLIYIVSGRSDGQTRTPFVETPLETALVSIDLQE